MPPPEPRCYEHLIKRAADKLNIKCIPNRLSIITQPLNGRPACHYCGQCNRGCMTNSNFSSPNVLLFPAQKTGRLTIKVNAMAREVATDQQLLGGATPQLAGGVERAQQPHDEPHHRPRHREDEAELLVHGGPPRTAPLRDVPLPAYPRARSRAKGPKRS